MANSTFKETTIYDYIPQIKEKFPYLAESDIKLILNYGWRLIYLANLAGCDTLVTSTSNKFWFYIGNLTKSPLLHFNYYKRQLIRKMQFIYRRIKPEWDGYYYTALSSEEANKLLFKGKGRKKINYIFNNKYIFKYKDACKLYYSAFPYIIKFQYIIDIGFKRFYSKLRISNPEIVEIKESSTFKDILVDNNEYDLI